MYSNIWANYKESEFEFCLIYHQVSLLVNVMISNRSRAFTLIEMLIVIIIIGILAAALIPRLQSIQWRARDTKRKTDLKTIYNANEIHKFDNGQYANSGAFIYSNTLSTWMTGLVGTYLTSVPVDPINNGWALSTTGIYNYIYINVYGEWFYSMSTILENTKDPDRCAVKTYVYYPWSYQTRCAAWQITPREQAYYYDPNNIINGKH